MAITMTINASFEDVFGLHDFLSKLKSLIGDYSDARPKTDLAASIRGAACTEKSVAQGLVQQSLFSPSGPEEVSEAGRGGIALVEHLDATEPKAAPADTLGEQNVNNSLTEVPAPAAKKAAKPRRTPPARGEPNPLTLADVSAVVTRFDNAGLNRADIKTIVNGMGYASIGNLPPADYPAFTAQVEKLIAAAGK